MVFIDASSLKQKKNNDIIMYQLGSRQTDKMSLFLCIYLKLAQAIRIKVTLQYKVINPSSILDYDCLATTSGRFVLMVVGLIGTDSVNVYSVTGFRLT